MDVLADVGMKSESVRVYLKLSPMAVILFVIAMYIVLSPVCSMWLYDAVLFHPDKRNYDAQRISLYEEFAWCSLERFGLLYTG